MSVVMRTHQHIGLNLNLKAENLNFIVYRWLLLQHSRKCLVGSKTLHLEMLVFKSPFNKQQNANFENTENKNKQIKSTYLFNCKIIIFLTCKLSYCL